MSGRGVCVAKCEVYLLASCFLRVFLSRVRPKNDLVIGVGTRSRGLMLRFVVLLFLVLLRIRGLNRRTKRMRGTIQRQQSSDQLECRPSVDRVANAGVLLVLSPWAADGCQRPRIVDVVYDILHWLPVYVLKPEFVDISREQRRNEMPYFFELYKHSWYAPFFEAGRGKQSPIRPWVRRHA